jgi:hypothetical protein
MAGSDTNDVTVDDPGRFPTKRQAERVLAGEVGRDGVGAPLMQLVGSLREPATPPELADADAVVARLAAVARAGAVPVAGPSRRRTFVRRLVTAKAAALAAVALVGVSAVAAATGTLPSAVEDGLKKVGIDVSSHDASPGQSGDDEAGDDDRDTADDEGDEDATTTTAVTTTSGSLDVSTTIAADDGSTTTTTATSGPVGPDPTGAAHAGLCTAWRAHGEKNMEATAFANLAAAATKAGQTIEQFCADVPVHGPDGTVPGDTAPGHDGDHGKPDDTPGDTAPGHDGDHGSSGNGHGTTTIAGPTTTKDHGKPDDPGGDTPGDTAPGHGKNGD